ncbi:ABC transporter permease, partial [Candidatus Sumerlaeota bacterium]|nr:ABC transporter permease [Candidatus Sumerlaeota bacterium]
MGKVWAIAANTFKEAVRNRILYILLIFAIVLLLFSGAVRELTVSAQERVIQSLGLGCISIFGLLIAVFVGIGLVYNELDKKTIYTIISKPIDRWQFILGKYFGLLLTIYVNILIMTLFFYCSLYFQSFTSDQQLMAFYASWEPGQPPGSLAIVGFWARAVGLSVAHAVKSLCFFPDKVTGNLQIVVVMTCIELAIVTAFAVLYSSFTTPTLSAILTVFTFVIGRGNEDIIRYTWYLERHGLDSMAEKIKWSAARFVAHVAPNLKIFYSDTVGQALSRPSVTVDWHNIAYGLIYSAMIV